MTKQERIEQLEKEIHHHNLKYFIDNDPEISDEEFDRLTEELKKAKPDSPVLFELVGEIGEIGHPEPMLSIEKRFNHAAIVKWAEDSGADTFIVEPKYDGMAARYQSGTLATRGNGRLGEDISERLDYLNIIGGKLPKDNENAYGEIVIPLTYFSENLAEEYKNPRNAVVGIMKSKQVKEAGRKALLDGGVHFVLHDKAQTIEAPLDDIRDDEKWETLLEQTFQTDYPLDGAVIKIKDKSLREKLGRTQHHDKWQVAYKTPAERKWTKVKEIKDQVGRTGRVTSVAVVEPIDLSGATVTNVTLHNPEYIEESKIGVRSKVEVMRSGEVIPFITKVEPATHPYKLPEKCPVCSTKLKREGKYLICPNLTCPARLSQSIEYFFKTLDVEELGPKRIEKFINEFKLKNAVDFYKLQKKQIADLEGFGEKSAEKIVKNIQATLDESITPEDLLQALGMQEIGPATSRWILDKYGFENLPKLEAEDLEDVKGIGKVKAKHFVEQIKDRWWIVKELKSMGLKLKH